MAVDMFMKIEGADGESKDHAHTDEIDVLAWSWGMSQSGTFHTGGGGGSGKVDVQDISFTKYQDLASATLMLFISNGKHIPEATLTVRKAGENPLENYIVKMKDVMVTSLSTGGSGGEERLTENVTLNFAKVEVAYTSQDKAGSKDKTKEYKWNIEANEQM